MGEFSDHVLYHFSRAASEQGGVISGDNPTKYNASNPIRLWVIQLVLIVGMTQFLSLFLSRIRQPRVIAEVIGGIVLGPSVMGHIPHFKTTIFPTESLAVLTITANVGLLLFLFLVGLEIDTRVMKKNIFTAATVSFAGLVLPLGLGAALGIGIYNEFIPDSVNFGLFLLFVAVAIGITAFPVLCRILTELKLLDTEVGLITLAAGSVDDVVGWILLALTVALVNSTSALTALYILLASAAYTIFLLFPGRWAFRWFAKWTGSLEQGSPTPAMMTVTLLCVFASAFFTDIIGIHAIFGGFLVGILVPHDNGLAISLVEKLEDLVTIVFLPIYFTLSGLRTDLSLLNSGIAWGYIVLICLVAFTSKFVGAGFAARMNGFGWRQAGAIGSLMSCKGLVELIVLNIGLQANILTPRAFSMFVVHALVLTFMTTPLVLLFYPTKYRVHLRDDQKLLGIKASQNSKTNSDSESKTRFTLILDRIEALPAAMTLSQLLHNPPFLPVISSSDVQPYSEKGLPPKPAQPVISIEALRLMELTNRTSAILRSQEAETIIHNDPVVSIYQRFGQLNHFNISAKLSVANFSEYPQAIAHHVSSTSSDMVVIPWPRGTTHVSDDSTQIGQLIMRNPFDGVFNKTAVQDQTNSVVYSEFIRHVFAQAPSDVALFVDRSVANSSVEITPQHIFLPFLGGPDDRLALSFLVQLCENPLISATVVRIVHTKGAHAGTQQPHDDVAESIPHDGSTAADTIYAPGNTQTQLLSNTADNILWDQYTASHSPRFAAALARISFRTESTESPLRCTVELAKKEVAVANGVSDNTPIIFAGRSRRLAIDSLSQDLVALVNELGLTVSASVPKTLGHMGAALVASDVKASLLIFQAAPAGH